MDTEIDGSSEDALGDDVADGSDDEDGLTFISPLVVGQAASLNIAAGVGNNILNAWIDWNGDGDWDDIGEHIASDFVLGGGGGPFLFGVPAGAVPGETFARIRLTNNLGQVFGPTGVAPSGEVEDYKVTIEPAPADTPPTANDDNAVTAANEAIEINVAANDFDPDGDLDPTTATQQGLGPINGALVNNGDGTFIYTPNLNFVGGDIFGYEICDMTNRCDTATVNITVTAPPPPGLGGSLTGMTPQKITCQTAGQREVIQSGVKTFDCSLIVNQGDRVRVTIDAIADQNTAP